MLLTKRSITSRNKIGGLYNTWENVYNSKPSMAFLCFSKKDYDNHGKLIWFDKLTSTNDTGGDIIPGFVEFTQSAGAFYTGLINKSLEEKFL